LYAVAPAVPAAPAPASAAPAEPDVPSLNTADEEIRRVLLKPVTVPSSILAALKGATEKDLMAKKVPELKEALSAFGKGYPNKKEAAVALLYSCLASMP
jgi:hypothetical protein